MPLTTENTRDNIGHWTAEQLAEAHAAVFGCPPWLTPEALLWLIATGICEDADQATDRVKANQIALRDGGRIAESRKGGLIMHLRSAWKEPRLIDGDVVVRGIVCQLRPHTAVCAAVSMVTVYGGNWLNCDLPAGWELHIPRPAHVEFCSHAEPWLLRHGLRACPMDCAHRRLAERVVDAAELRVLLAGGYVNPTAITTAQRVVERDEFNLMRREAVRITVPVYESRRGI